MGKEMPARKASGISLSNKDASVVLGMVARDDREHDIAAWFGINQGRIAEVKQGSHGTLVVAPAHELPPKGPPGVKGRRLRQSVRKALALLEEKGASAMAEALASLQDGAKQYDANET
jgi:hypothetical protein